MPKIGLGLVALVLSVAIGVFAPEALAKSSASKYAQLQAMDAILESAGSLENFLKADFLIDQYFAAARAYYLGDQDGKDTEKVDRFPRESFDAILASFKDLIKRHPEFAERAWRKRHVRPMLLIKTVQKGYGISQAAGFRSKFAAELGLTESDFSKPAEVSGLESRIEQVMTELRELMDQKPANKQARNEQGEKLKAFKHGEFARQVRADLLRRLLSVPELNSRFRSSDADIVFGAYADMRSRAKEFLPELSKYSRAIDFLMSTLSNPESLANNRDLFETANVLEWTDNSEFEFIEISRRFHSLFRGLYWRECTAGDCKLLDWIHESRYAIPLLEDGREIHVLRDGEFSGYISNVLVERNRRRYFALEVITPYLKNRILTWKFQDGRMQLAKRSVLDVWIDHEMNDNPPVEGFLAGQSRALNPGGGLEAVRLSEAWLRGKTAGHSNTFKPVDPMASALAQRPKFKDMNDDYLNDNLIFELGVIPANEAVLLKPAEFDFAQLRNPFWIAEQLAKTPQVEAKLWGTLFFYPQLDIQGSGLQLMARAWAIITAYANPQSPNHAAAKSFMEKCEYHCIQAVFKYAFPGEISLPEFESALKWIAMMPRDHIGSLLEQMTEQKWKAVVAQTGSKLLLSDVKRLMRLQTSDTTALLMVSLALDHVPTMEDFLWLTDPANSDWGTLTAYSDFFVKHLRRIQALKPTTKEWLKLYERLTSAREHYLAVTAAVEHVKNAGEFLNRLRWPSRSGTQSPDAKYEQNQFLLKQAGRFMKLKPSYLHKRFYLLKIEDTDIYNKVSDIFYGRISCGEIVENKPNESQK